MNHFLLQFELGSEINLVFLRALTARLVVAKRCLERERQGGNETVVAMMRGRVDARETALVMARANVLSGMVSMPETSEETHVVYGRIGATDGGSLGNLSVRVTDDKDRPMGAAETDALGRFTIRIPADSASDTEKKKLAKPTTVFVSVYDNTGKLLFKDERSLGGVVGGAATRREITVP